MKHLSFTFLAVLFALFACASCDNDELKITEDNIIGEWVEDYSDYPYFASESRIIWTFRPDCRADVHVYDIFAGDSVYSKSYHIGMLGDNVISLNVFMSDYSGADYEITKLTKNTMEWQKVGVGKDFLPGSLGSEFKRFTKLTDKNSLFFMRFSEVVAKPQYCY